MSEQSPNSPVQALWQAGAGHRDCYDIRGTCTGFASTSSWSIPLIDPDEPCTDPSCPSHGGEAPDREES